MPAHYSHTITHNLIVFNGVRECFAFAKPLKPAAQSKACQRVCLSQRTDEKEKSTKAQQWLYVMRAKVLI